MTSISSKAWGSGLLCGDRRKEGALKKIFRRSKTATAGFCAATEVKELIRRHPYVERPSQRASVRRQEQGTYLYVKKPRQWVSVA